MKKDVHPENYRFVVFQDLSCDYSFLTRSTVETKETIKWEDGNEYPLYKLEISNKSHPSSQENKILLIQLEELRNIIRNTISNLQNR